MNRKTTRRKDLLGWDLPLCLSADVVSREVCADNCLAWMVERPGAVDGLCDLDGMDGLDSVRERLATEDGSIGARLEGGRA